MRAVLLAAVLVLACCAAEASCSLGAPARHPCGVEALFLAGTSYAPLPYSSRCNSLQLVARRLYCCCVTCCCRSCCQSLQDHRRLRLA